MPHSTRFSSSGRELAHGRVDGHQSLLPEGAGAEGAPKPQFGRCDQASLHRVPVHIAKLLDLLAPAPHVENRKSASARSAGAARARPRADPWAQQEFNLPLIRALPEARRAEALSGSRRGMNGAPSGFITTRKGGPPAPGFSASCCQPDRRLALPSHSLRRQRATVTALSPRLHRRSCIPSRTWRAEVCT